MSNHFYNQRIELVSLFICSRVSASKTVGTIIVRQHPHFCSMHDDKQRRLKIFTWHIHGTYLYYLSQCNCEFYIPVNEKKEEGYYGRGETFPFGANVIEVPAAQVRLLDFDCVLFQTNKNYLVDQYEILSEVQRKLPRIYLEHDPPAKNPTDQKHIMNDPEVTFVHVTDFNKLFWLNEVPEVQVIDHGVIGSSVNYTGELSKGLVIVNHLHQRGRKLGADIFEEVKKEIDLDLIGMGTKEYSGLGEILHPQLPAFISRYRFVFNPIRYTSLGLAVLEAMSAGLPLVALATTEYVTVIKDGFNGFIHTDIDYLKEKMHLLATDRELAAELGQNAKQTITERFSIQRFTNDWEKLFASVKNKHKKYEEENSIY